MPSRSVALCLGVLCLAAPQPLRADSAEIPDKAPEGQPAFGLEVETGLVIPVATKRLCPSGYGCIIGVGWAFGANFSYRWAKGTGLGFGYEFWLLGADQVYEVAVTQAFTALLQQSFMPSRSAHPLLRLRGGFLMLGPSFRVDAIGGTAELGFGTEIEVSPSSLVTILLTGNILRTGSFTTEADGALRAVDGTVDAALVFRLGYTFLL